LVYHGSGDDLDHTLERAAHQALTVFYECHMPAIGDPKLPTHHVGWVLSARYAQHVSSLL
jgi:septal ring factor EnvC (AmiA/AmiB activator)